MLTWADVDASIHADLSAAVGAQRELRPSDVIVLGLYAETLPAGHPERDRVTGILGRQAPLSPEEVQAGMVRAGNVLNLDGSLGDFGRLQVGSILSRVR